MGNHSESWGPAMKTVLIFLLALACAMPRPQDYDFESSIDSSEEESMESNETSCPEVCPAIFKPVCGSDGNTYSNACQLQVDSCNFDTIITVASPGECNSGGIPGRTPGRRPNNNNDFLFGR